ncbi:MAG: class A beta-lactamase-related serine hydrolase [Candidatus Margulisbacteria bacterium]|nr:class A beta-lactamase-related serine hydrolase [Candidatus Margulisiibacteriota bacterium]
MIFSARSILKIGFVLSVFFLSFAYPVVPEILCNNKTQPQWISDIMKDINAQIDKYALPGGIVGIVIKDLTTGEYFSMNGNIIFNPASVIKVPVMVEAFHQVEKGKLSLDERLVLRQENKLVGSGSLQYFRCGKRFSVRRLIELMITDSDNTATNMLVNRLGMQNINEYMRRLGLRHTVIKDPTMFCKVEGQHNITSPVDMVILLEKMYKGTLVSKAASEDMLSIMKGQRHKWGIARFLPPTVTIANKTGSLDFVRNDVGIILDKDKPYVISIFSKHLPSNHYGSILVGSLSKVVYERRKQT